MPKRIILPVFIAVLAVGMSAFALAQNEKTEAERGGHYDIRMLGFTICIVDHGSNRAHLYRESKDDKRLELFKSIDLSKAGSETIEYIAPASLAANE